MDLVIVLNELTENVLPFKVSRLLRMNYWTKYTFARLKSNKIDETFLVNYFKACPTMASEG